MNSFNSLGEHMLLEYYGCDAVKLAHAAEVQKFVLDAVRRAHGTIVTDIFHNFSPHGVSGVVVIAESHVTIHTWPEHACAAVDIFSCGTTLDHSAIREWIRAGLRATNVESRELTRG